MMASVTKSPKTPQLDKLTVVQLKGALARRNLDAAGTKDELLARLKEYEEQNAKTVSEEKKTVKENFKPLTKGKIRNGYDSYIAVKTVLIQPFHYDSLNSPDFVTWLKESKSFNIQKTFKGEMAAELIFPTAVMGEVACTDLKAKLTKAKVSHPLVHFLTQEPFKFETELEKLIKPRPKGDFWSRLVVLEGLSKTINTEEKLHEFFPEAMHALSFQFSSDSPGLAFLEFLTIEEALDYVKLVGDERIEIEDTKVKVSPFADVFKEWHKRIDDEMLSARGDKPDKVMEDKKRLLLNNEMNRLENYKDSMEDVEVKNWADVAEKFNKFSSCYTKLNEKRALMRTDTSLRFNKGIEKMPESEKDMSDLVKIMIMNKKPNSGLQLKKNQLPQCQKDMAELESLMDDLKHEENRIRNKMNTIKCILPNAERLKLKSAEAKHQSSPVGGGSARPQGNSVSPRGEVNSRNQNKAPKNPQITTNKPGQGKAENAHVHDVCFKFAKGDCKRGNKCRFSHDRSSVDGGIKRSGAEVARSDACFKFLTGDCTRGNTCRFSHDQSLLDGGNKRSGVRDLKRELCIKFSRGLCYAGDDCRYSHESHSAEVPGSNRSRDDGGPPSKVRRQDDHHRSRERDERRDMRPEDQRMLEMVGVMDNMTDPSRHEMAGVMGNMTDPSHPGVMDIRMIDPNDVQVVDHDQRDRRPEDMRPEDRRPEDIRPVDYRDMRPEDIRPEDMRPEDRRPEDIRPEDYRDRRPEDRRPEDIRPEDYRDMRPEDIRPDNYRERRPDDIMPEEYHDRRPEDHRDRGSEHDRSRMPEYDVYGRPINVDDRLAEPDIRLDRHGNIVQELANPELYRQGPQRGMIAPPPVPGAAGTGGKKKKVPTATLR